MAFRILQWNIKGFYNNSHELQLLIKEHSPSLISLQETHLPHSKTAHISNLYTHYFFNLPQNTSSKQGIAVLVRKDIPHKQIPVQSAISTIAIEINLGFKFTVLCIYIPPQQTFSLKDLQEIVYAFNTSLLITGDLNAWSPLWGSVETNHRGRTIEDLILTENMVF